ncbi:MAG: hypothetical protein A2X77_01385 [Gammaproteobacteria bacterium GWE2_42_36]|nr:MAG: hypothetical protein A2X77_01385 [Gammaproteobacteria bacterium GWE2_42_36]HCU05899.1 hypothetical protein [Coxiellaceae bacterium]
MKKPIILSIALHALFFLAIVVQLPHNHSVLIGNPPIIHTFLYAGAFHPVKKPSELSSQKSLPTQHSSTALNTNRSEATINATQNKPNQSSPIITSGHADPLAMLLHDRIQSQLRIPDEFSPMIEGKWVTLEFDLLATGSIQQALITHSSGIQAVDQAVIDAVNAIQPVIEASSYLHNETQCHYTINIRLG